MLTQVLTILEPACICGCLFSEAGQCLGVLFPASKHWKLIIGYRMHLSAWSEILIHLVSCTSPEVTGYTEPTLIWKETSLLVKSLSKAFDIHSTFDETLLFLLSHNWEELRAPLKHGEPELSPGVRHFKCVLCSN